MNKELQDLAWSVLPKEFKEEVKKMFQKDINTCNNMNQAMRCILVDIFGLHNLTSDAEGEEMLHIRRSEVTSRYEAYSKESANVKNNEPYLQFCEGRLNVLTNLFGSKCLPDLSEVKRTLSENLSEQKPAEPKFKVGDKVKIAKNGNVYNNSIGEIIDISSNGSAYILFCNGQAWFRLTDLEPYAEPDTSHDTPVCENHSDNTSQKEVKMNSNRNLSKNIVDCDKHFDNILKDSFRNERRLNIAAMAMQGIVSNPTAMNGPKLIDGDEEILAKWSLKFADALIAECELTEKLKGE